MNFSTVPPWRSSTLAQSRSSAPSPPKRLGVQRLAERGRARYVGEEHGHGLAGLGPGWRLGSEHSATAAAEAEPVRILVSTARAGDHTGRVGQALCALVVPAKGGAEPPLCIIRRRRRAVNGRARADTMNPTATQLGIDPGSDRSGARPEHDVSGALVLGPGNLRRRARAHLHAQLAARGARVAGRAPRRPPRSARWRTSHPADARPRRRVARIRQRVPPPGLPGRRRGRQPQDAAVPAYHGWTYDLDGRLRKAPRCDREPGFDKSEFSLVPVAVEVWDGFVFVNPDPDALPLAETYPELAGFWNEPSPQLRGLPLRRPIHLRHPGQLEGLGRDQELSATTARMSTSRASATRSRRTSTSTSTSTWAVLMARVHPVQPLGEDVPRRQRVATLRPTASASCTCGRRRSLP